MINRSQDQYLRTGNRGDVRVNGETGAFWVEAVDANGVWVAAEPGVEYATKEEADEAAEAFRE